MLIPGANLGSILVGDLFDDIFFAYQKFDDSVLKSDLGRHGFGEAFGDNTNAWNLDSFAVGMAALREHGPQESLKLEVQSGVGTGGFTFGADDTSGRRFRVGDIMSFYDRGTIIEDYVSAVEVEDSRGQFCTEFITIGDDRAIKDGWNRVIDRLKGFASLSRAIANGTG
jgi:hypothetical protein